MSKKSDRLLSQFAIFGSQFVACVAFVAAAWAGEPPLPAVGVTFKTDDAFVQRLYDAAERGERANVVQFIDAQKALVEGGGYANVWLETQPMGGAMYAVRNLEVGVNNQLLFMQCQRADGRLPGMIVSNRKTHKLAPAFGHLQGYFFPTSAVDVYYLMGRDRDFLKRLAATLEAYDAYLWRTHDSNGDGILETWCVWDTGEDNCSRLFNAPNAWTSEAAPTLAALPKPKKPGDPQVPYQSMDITSWSYENRRVLAEISKELGDGREAFWREKADQLQRHFIEKLWRPERDACFDRDRNGRFMDALIHNNLRCMWTKIFTQEMADAFIRRHLLNPAEFWTPTPLPSIAANDSLFRNAPGNNWSGQPEGLTYQRAIRALENYGHFAEVTLLGEKLVTLVGKTCSFRQQYDPFVDGKTLSDAPDAKPKTYGPTILSVLEYMSRMYGIHLDRDRILWSAAPNNPKHLETTQRWGEKTYTLQIADGAMTARLGDRELFHCTANVRVVTDVDGRVRQLIGIAPTPQKVALQVGDVRWSAVVPPNTVWAVAPSGAITLVKQAPFDYPHRPSAGGK